MNSLFASSFFGDRIDSGNSDCHHYEFVRNDRFGISLFLDGIIQSTERDQAIYHSNMVNKANQVKKIPENILIIGGAGGGLLPYIFLNYSETIRNVSIVDIDEKLFNVARRHMSSWNKSCLQDKRVKITYEDGLKTLNRNNERYDFIFCDISDDADWTKSSYFYGGVNKKIISDNLTDNGAFIFHQAHRQFNNNTDASMIYPFESSKTSAGLVLDDPLQVCISSFETPWSFNAYVKTHKA